MKKYADIIIDNRASETDRIYTYLIADQHLDSLEIGMRVIIPFGQGNRKIKGLVVDIKDSYLGRFNLKETLEIIDEKPIVNKDLIDLALWMSDYYISPYLDSLRTVLPPGDFKKLSTKVSLSERASYDELSGLELDIVRAIKNGYNDLDRLRLYFKDKNILSSIRSLEEEDYIKTSLLIETSIKKNYERYISINPDIDDPVKHVGTRAYKQKEILEYLMGLESVKVNELIKKLSTSLSTIRSLEEKELVKLEFREVYRPAVKKEIPAYRKHKLNEEQEDIVKIILESDYSDYLIHGVTGSGKTEVYLQLVEALIKEDKDVIVLVPEIALTPQTIDRFVGRFPGQVAVLHSKLSFGERFDEWRKIREGEVKIVVGARSAVFAPFKNLAAVIVDEEHETSYKSGMNPKYDALEVAKKRLEGSAGKLIRGSATPSVESYYKACKNEILLLELNKRANKKPLPAIELVDMRDELTDGNRTMFSRKLYRALESNLDEKRQAILFLNRRGYSTFVSCRQCGYVVKCNECEVSMTYHRRTNRCKCHYCGSTKEIPRICPECSSPYIKYFGTGTEQVEDFTRSIFKNARIDRMDLDTVSRKGSYDHKLTRMKNGETDILVGTQMIAKGLDFSNVTLVGIITADTSLNLPDFRSAERTFQLITQVAGRAGRGEKEGKVIVQSYTPEHYSIEYAKRYDYKGFYQEEIALREAFKYPPFTNIYSIVVYGIYINKVEERALELGEIFRKLIAEKNLKADMMGPYPAPIDKIKNKYRYQLLFKVEDDSETELKELINRVCIMNEYRLNFQDIRFNIDVDPISVL